MKKQKLRELLVVGVLAAGSVLGGCASQKGTFVGDLANSEIGRLLADTKSTSTDIRTSAGSAYFRSSALNKGRRTKIDQVYKRLIRLNDKKEIKQKIDYFADYELGDQNDWTTKIERAQAYEALWIRWMSEEYKNGLRDRPLLQVLRDSWGF